MTIVDAKDLCKSYGARAILNHADVVVRSRERIGIVGLNGAGKSTLARILAGLEAPDQGTVSKRRGAGVRYLHQAPTFPGNPTIQEAAMAGLEAWNAAVTEHHQVTQRLASESQSDRTLIDRQAELTELVERLGGWEQSARISSLLTHLNINRPDTRVDTLSGGERRRVALAQVLVAQPDLAILDEPTNHLDAETIAWLERFLLDDYDGALLLITHDRYLLDRVATRTLEVENGAVHSYDGGYQLYLENKAERLALLERTERNRQNFLRTELDWLRRQPKARGTKQKARVDRAESALATRAPQGDKSFTFSIDTARQGKRLLELDQLSLTLGGKCLIDSLDFLLTQGERVGIVGKNGSGKTTLLRTILGEHAPSGGTVSLGKTVKVAYFDQHRSDLDLDASVFDNVLGDQTRIRLGEQEIEPYTYLGRFGFSAAEARQKAGSLSGGERARVALARLLRQSANLIILDEPTNDLDVTSLGALEALLVDFGVSALVVTHDRWFLDRVATSLLVFESEGHVSHHVGNYTTYAEKRRDVPKTAKAEAKPPARKDKPSAPKLSYKEARELDGLLDAIDAAEQAAAALEAQLSDPSTYASPTANAAELAQKHDQARAEVERLTARWEQLEEKRAAAESH